MEHTAEERWKLARQLEKQLHENLEERESSYVDVENLLRDLRVACENAIFLDIDYSTKESVETRLWDVHSHVHNRYRKMLAKYKLEEHISHRVERRKLEKRYVDFLKTSQYFYKGFIQRLASHYDVPKLRKIAQRISLDTLSISLPLEVPSEAEQKTLMLCYAALLHLGDLFRYRNMVRTKDRLWEVPFGYYRLANDLYPASGNAFHQMALTALEDADHLHTVYYLYRSLAAEKPHPFAANNLKKEFNKIIKEWEMRQTSMSPHAVQTKRKAGTTMSPLVSWFLRLHAKLHAGVTFAGHEELEYEILSQISMAAKDQDFGDILDSFVLINLAAEFVLKENRKAITSQTDDFSCASLFRFNARMMVALLNLLRAELKSSASNGGSLIYGQTPISSRGFSDATIYRILPAIRFYSMWLVLNSSAIIQVAPGGLQSALVENLLIVYCSTMTAIMELVDLDTLQTVDYTLKEDVDIIGFRPLHLCTMDNQTAAGDTGIIRDRPHVEMLTRFRELFIEAMALVSDSSFPVEMVGGVFQYKGVANVSQDTQMIRSFEYQSKVLSEDGGSQSGTSWAETPPRQQNDSRSSSVAPPESMSSDMHDMVNKLTAPSSLSGSTQMINNETSYGMHSSTAADIFAPIEVHRGQTSSHSATPALRPESGIWGDSPFKPQPGELRTTPERPMTALRLSDQQSSNKTQRFSMAKALDYASPTEKHFRASLGSNTSVTDSGSARKPSSEQQREILNKILHQEQSSPPGLPSSFGNGSSESIYASTPFGQRPMGPSYAIANQTSRKLSTNYGDDQSYEQTAMLQSSLFEGSQPIPMVHFPTPPGGQGDWTPS